MSTGWDEVWVTLVENDKALVSALVLAKSLRNTFTHRKLLALHGSDCSKITRKQLENFFDGILKVEVPLEIAGCDLETYAKILLWSLPFCQKFVFLHSTCVVLRNCDELFGTKSLAAGKSTSTGIDTNVLVLSPSLTTYDEIMDFVKETGNWEGEIQNHFHQYLKNNRKLSILKKKYTTYFGNNAAKHFDDLHYSPAIVRIHDDGKTWLEPENKQNKNGMTNILRTFHQLRNETMYSLFVENHVAKPVKTIKNEPIAIVGMSCRFPGANNLDEFWNLMISKGDAIRPLPEERWRPEQWCPMDTYSRKVQAGWLSCPIDEFDGKFFGISPMELTFTDPQQRLLLEVTWESLEDAAIDYTALHGDKLGIFTGIWTHDYNDLLIESGYREDEFFRTYMGCAFGTTASRPAHFLEATGPNICVESGCSSSIVAVGVACDSLRKHTSNVAIAGGVNLIPHPFKYSDLKNLLSNDGHCKTFDATADGFGRAEGVGVLVLKRLSDAIRDNDKIYAQILGYGASQEGISHSVGTPTVEMEALSMQIALDEANVNPLDVSFIETHGTGTAVGDPMEVKAIAKVYGKERTKPLIIGSVKTNVGHTESCSGITGIIKTVLSLQKEEIPPHRCLITLNPLIDLESIPAMIPLEKQEWKSGDGCPRIAGVSSFGITGTDAHVIIQEAPKIKDKFLLANKTPTQNILTLSAKSKDVLNILIEKYTKFLTEPYLSLNDVAYTASTGRTHFTNRVAVVGGTCEEVQNKLVKGLYEQGTSSAEKPKICFLYTGQGSQYFGMGKTLYDNYPVFRNYFDICDKTLQKLFNISIQDALWRKDDGKLHGSLYSQTSIFVIEYCLTQLWKSWGITPDCVVGHSLGEFASAAAAGILNLQDALTLVGARSKLIDGLPCGKMLVVKASEEATKHLLKIFEGSNDSKYWLDFAAINSPEQITLAGSPESVHNFATFCQNNDIKTHVLDATHAFHSRDMEPILDEYRKTAETLNYSVPSCKFISGVEGKSIEGHNEELHANYWVRHTREPVRFDDASKEAYHSGARIFIEIGPHPVLCALLKRNLENFKSNDEPMTFSPSMKRKTDEVKTLLDTVAELYVKGMHIDWKGFHKINAKKKITLPSYPFQRKKHWFNPEHNLAFKLTQQFKKHNHPLLGLSLVSPTDNAVYQKFLNLKTEDYIVDHMVGEHFIYPGAGYIEMSLAAGSAHLFPASSGQEIDSSGYILTLEDLVIKAPLELIDEKTYEFQTIISTVANENEECYSKVQTYSRKRGIGNEDSKDWMCHTEAKFTTSDRNTDEGCTNLEELKTQICKPVFDNVYSDLSALGYKFGPTFQSIRKMWKHNSEYLCEVQLTAESDDERPEYYIHPTIIDAMLQASIIASFGDNLNKLYLPVGFKLLKWIQKSSTPLKFIHVFPEANGSLTVILYDATGRKLAVLKGAEFAPTTLEGFERSLGGQKFIAMFNEHWKPCKWVEGPSFNFKTAALPSLENGINEIVTTEAFEIINGEQLRLNKMITYGIIKTLQAMGWSPSLNGTTYSIKQLMQQLKVEQEFYFLFRRMLEILQEDDYLELESDGVKILRYFPSLDELNHNDETSTGTLENHAMISVFENLPKILTKETTALAVLFPQKSNYNSVSNLLETNNILQEANNRLLKAFEYVIEKRIKVSNRTSPLKVLEINAGSSSLAQSIFPIFAKHGIQYVYDCTDNCKEKLENKKLNLEEFKNCVQFKCLNIEEDPKTQGFAPHEYDIIISGNSLHSTKNLIETCNNIRHLLCKHGLVLIAEIFSPQRQLDMTQGLLNGYWETEDKEIRLYHPIINENQWENLLKTNGFGSVLNNNLNGTGIIIAEASDTNVPYNSNLSIETQAKSKANRKIWILFSDESQVSKDLNKKLRLADKTVVTIKVGENYERTDKKKFDFWIRADSKPEIESVLRVLKIEKSSTSIEGVVYLWGLNPTYKTTLLTQSFLNLLQSMLKIDSNPLPKMYLVTENITSVTENMSSEHFEAAPLLGMLRSFRSENPSMFCKSIDLETKTKFKIQSSQIFTELWKDDEETFISYRNNVRHVARLKSSNAALAFQPLTLPNKERFSLVLPKTKSISDLKFGNLPLQKLQPHEVEIQIKAAGLNFKDVFNVLKPTAEFNNSNSVGADIAGIISAFGSQVKNRKIGDAVIGSNLQGDALPSHSVISADQLVSLPKNMTFAEGATLPCVFATAYHCLISVGNLKQGETILIHTASGGVGLVAIQIAHSVGANIIATAGSPRKRKYLKSIGIEHVFNSRDLSFGEGVKNATNNVGVNVVLNSITGPGFKETSLECCSPNARFLEMSKLNIWTQEEVSKLRPDVKYSIEDLSAPNPGRWRNLMQKLESFINEGKVRALPFTRFDALNIKEALHFLEKAKQIGKVVCVYPENRSGNEIVCPLFNDRSTYLITGGLRGIGLEVAKWMVKSGAKYLILAARSKPTDSALAEIKPLSDSGATVIIYQMDIGNFDQCKELINTIGTSGLNMPPLRGVMHCAGCLSDAIISNQTWEKFQTTMNPKVHGGWHLHSLTKDLNLEHFVSFSSIVAVIGSPGQSNHAASNTYLDCLAQYRNSIGLPATSINWGQWGETGIAAEKNILGFTPFTTSQGIKALEHVMKSNINQIAVCDGDVGIWKNMFSWAKKYFEELKTNTTAEAKSDKRLIISTEEFWKEMSKTKDNDQRYEIIQRHLSTILAAALKYEGNEKFEKHQEFQELGMDSLMMIEFRNQIQSLLGSKVIISANDMADCPTLHILTNKIFQLIYSNVTVDKEQERISRNQLIREDAVLWSHIQGNGVTIKRSEIKTVLLTGATGFLGPFVLRNLCSRSNIKTIYCIVRDNKKQTVVERLVHQLKRLELENQVDMSKVRVIKGDVSEVALGLNTELYDSLATEVDAVVNCAVYANHLDRYRKSDSKFSNLRAVNVIGTQRVLEFAAAKKTKYVYHASTFLAMWKGESDTLPEHWPHIDDFDSAPNFGYAISKFLGDILVGEATTNRQIPCQVFRFPKISGDSLTGRQFVKENHFFMKFLHYMKSELMPSFEIPMQIIPVDVCADLSLEIFFRDDVEPGMYNFFNPHSQNEKQISEVAKDFGHDVKHVEYDDFVVDLKSDVDNSLLYNWVDFYTRDDSVFRMHANGQLPIPILKVWLANPDDFFNKGKVSKILPNLKELIERPLDILRRDVKFAVENVDGIDL